MENASKALIMAGGVLIGVLILSLWAYLFVSFGTQAAEISKQNEQTKIAQFNTQFTSYEGKEGLTIYDIITVAGLAKQNNDYYENDNNYKVIVEIKRFSDNKRYTNIENMDDEKKKKLINTDKSLINQLNPSLPQYKCEVEY